MKVLGSEKVKAVSFTAGFNDFAEGKDEDLVVRQWQEAYFQLLQWKNTWQLPYEMDVKAWNTHEAYVYMVTKAMHKDKVLELLEDLGYQNVQTEEFLIEEVEPDYEKDVFGYYFDY